MVHASAVHVNTGEFLRLTWHRAGFKARRKQLFHSIALLLWHMGCQVVQHHEIQRVSVFTAGEDTGKNGRQAASNGKAQNDYRIPEIVPNGIA